MPQEQPPQPLDYAPPAPTRFSRMFWILLGIIALATVLFASLRRSNLPYGNDSYAKCASNLRQIGLGILLYCHENSGIFPDSLKTVAASEALTPSVFICPSSNDAPSTAPTRQAEVDDLAVPGHCSYVYIGKGLTDKAVLPNQVIVYEPPTNHGNGIHVLLSDGRPVFVDARRAAKIIADINAGKRPVMLPP